MQEIIDERVRDIDTIRSTHRTLMSRIINDNDTMSSIIFTDGTVFNSGTATVFGGTCFIHRYSHISFIFATDIHSTFFAEFSAIYITMREAIEIKLSNIIKVLDNLAAVTLCNELLIAKQQIT